jgi:PilZ domain
MSEAVYAIKRRSPRFITHFTVVLITRKGESRAESPAQVVDFSGFGLTIASHESLVPGEQVEIVPQEGPEYVVVCRVVSVHEIEKGQGVRAGLEFLKPIVPTGD